MVYDGRIATDVSAGQQSRELAGFFQLIATAAPGHALAELEAAMSAEIAHVAESGPTSVELQRSLAQAEAQFIYRVQTVGGFGGKSDQLNQYNVFVGDPGYFDRDLQRYRDATAGSVAAIADQCLVRGARVAVSVVPHGRIDLALPDSTKVVCS
jgi:zinc protease